MDIQLKIKHRMGFCSDSSVDITFPIHFVWEKHFFRNFGILFLVPYTKDFGKITQF